MIGLLIGLMIELTVLAIRLMIVILVWTFRLLVMGIAAIGALIASHQAQRAPADGIRRSLDPDLRWGVFQRDGYSCSECGSQTDLTVDHIHPVSLGGSNHPENLRTLCRSCNSRKGATVLVA
jgi:hypothetical protein